MSFAESFWGDNGFEVLMANFKDGSMASKEMQEFCSALLSLNELAGASFKRIASVKTQASAGTFNPLWIMLKTYAEHMCSHYGETCKRLHDLKSRIQKYEEQQKERQKQIKASEGGTEKAVRATRELSVALQDAKKEFHLRRLEIEKAKRAEVSSKDLEKLEARAKKAEAEYRQVIEKYNAARDDFERKMTESCIRLQDVEEGHLDEMRTFICQYFDLMENARKMVQKAEDESKANIASLTKAKLIEMFVATKKTGSEKPPKASLEDLSSSQLGATLSPLHAGTPEIGSKSPSQQSAASSSFNSFLKFGRSKSKKTDDGASTGAGSSVDAASSSGDVIDNDLRSVTSPVQQQQQGGSFDFLDMDDERSSPARASWDQLDKKSQKSNDDSSFDDSDSDDSEDLFHSKLRAIQIKEKHEVQDANKASAQLDISQIMQSMSLNPLDRPEPKRTTSRNGPRSSKTADESPSPLIEQQFPVSFNQEVRQSVNFDPLFETAVAPSPVPVVKPAQSTDSLEILSLFSSPNPTPTAAMLQAQTPASLGSSAVPSPAFQTMTPPPVPERAPPPPPRRLVPPLATETQNAAPPTPPPSVPRRQPSAEPLGPLTAIPEVSVSKVQKTEELPVIRKAQASAPPSTLPIQRLQDSDSDSLNSRRASTATITPLNKAKGATEERRSSAASLTENLRNIGSGIIPISFTASETIDALCTGLECLGLKISGRLTMSLTVEAARRLIAMGSKEDAYPLKFRVSPVSNLEFHHHKQLVIEMASPLEDSAGYEFRMTSLAQHLTKQLDKMSGDDDNEDSNVEIDILKYKLRREDCKNACPMAASFQSQQAFGSEAPAGKASALSLVLRHRGVSSCPVSIRNPSVLVKADNLLTVVSRPNPTTVDKQNGTIIWQVPDLTASSPDYLINADLRFRGTASANESKPISASLSFDGDGFIFSSLKLDLVSFAHFRIASIQKKFKTGRYEIEPSSNDS